MNHKATLGTISHGTLRTEDLLSSFADELERLAPNDPLISEARDRMSNESNAESEVASDIVNELIDALNVLAPPYCYFGAHEGDGADFGFWPSPDYLIDELPRIDDPSEHPAALAADIAASALRGEWDVIAELARKLSESPIGEECAFVNDHGNVTIYSADGKVISDFV